MPVVRCYIRPIAHQFLSRLNNFLKFVFYFFQQMASYNRNVYPVKKLSKFPTVGPDGELHLPPIERPKMEDPYANSKLLTYRLEKRKQIRLNKLMSVYTFSALFSILNV